MIWGVVVEKGDARRQKYLYLKTEEALAQFAGGR
jgi:hypothetical protein